MLRSTFLRRANPRDATRTSLPRRYQTSRHFFGTETLEPRLALSGVTLITHGFNSSADTWVTEMAEAIGQRSDLTIDQAIYRVAVTDPGYDEGPLDVTSQWLSGLSPTDASTPNPEIALVMDWSDVAGDLGSNYTRSTFDVAAAMAEALVSENFLNDVGQPLASLPFHLVGHSRGASLVGELAHLLGKKGIWVDQVTTHDPHPVDGIGEPNGEDYGDAPMVAWGNVTYWDNYWRLGANNLFDFSGEPIANTHDVELSNTVLADGGYGLFSGGSHSDVHLWYHGTIDLSENPLANDGAEDVPNDWYGGVHPERDASGYFYSRLVGGQRAADGLADDFLGGSASRQPVTVDELAWPNILQFTVDTTDSTFGVGTAIPLSVLPPGWRFAGHGDLRFGCRSQPIQCESDRSNFHGPPCVLIARTRQRGACRTQRNSGHVFCPCDDH